MLKKFGTRVEVAGNGAEATPYCHQIVTQITDLVEIAIPSKSEPVPGEAKEIQLANELIFDHQTLNGKLNDDAEHIRLEIETFLTDMTGHISSLKFALANHDK